MTQVGNSAETQVFWNQGAELTEVSRMKFRIADIVVRDRKRSASDTTSLAASIKQLGLLNPITIKPDGTLIAGLNRLEACKSLGWEEIEVSIADLDELNAELAEIDENIARSDLTAIQRA